MTGLFSNAPYRPPYTATLCLLTIVDQSGSALSFSPLLHKGHTSRGNCGVFAYKRFFFMLPLVNQNEYFGHVMTIITICNQNLSRKKAFC
jgi:hypothetical protein